MERELVDRLAAVRRAVDRLERALDRAGKVSEIGSLRLSVKLGDAARIIDSLVEMTLPTERTPA